jgi:hypothetical protein
VRRISRRTQLIAFSGLVLVFAAAFVLLRPQVGTLTDGEYIAIAKNTDSGRLYFKTRDVPCRVIRVWNVQVSCDYTPSYGAQTDKFRIYIDPRTNQVVGSDMSFDEQRIR